MNRPTHLLLTLAFLTATPAITQAEGVWESISGFFSKEKMTSKQTMLHLLVAEDKKELQIRVNGPFKVYDPQTEEHIITRKSGKEGVIKPFSEGIMWGEEFPGTHQIVIVPQKIGTTISVDGTPYQGTVTIYAIDNALSAVNNIDIESFLHIQLLSSLTESTPAELLSAFAITARTNAYFLAENPKNPYWSIKASSLDYKGSMAHPKNPKASQAIAETRNMILSRTGTHEKKITPFPIEWQGEKNPLINVPAKGVASKISIEEAQVLAKKGKTASQILERAFPSAKIELTGN